MAIFVDHYAVLGVEPTANPDMIKKAYRQLALQHHPDKAAPGGEADAAKFITALTAYEILIDVSKRKVYNIQYKKLSSIDPFSRTAPKQARPATHFPQRETDGSYGGGFWSHPARDGEEMDIGEDYPSDNESDLGSEYDTGVYEDGYADPHYEPDETSNDVDAFDGNDIHRGDFDATDNRHQFPPESADDDASPEPDQGADDEAGAGGADHREEENPAPKISHPVAEAFDQFHFSDLSKSHWQEEKVKGRYYKGALNELHRQKTECDSIDAKLRDIDQRLRRRVGDMPAGSVNTEEWDEALERRMDAAHRAVRDIRLATDGSLFVMRVEQQPRFWRLTDKRTWGVIDAIEKSGRHMGEMRSVLSVLEEIVGKMEGWGDEELREVLVYLRCFMSELRDWREEITSKP